MTRRAGLQKGVAVVFTAIAIACGAILAIACGRPAPAPAAAAPASGSPNVAAGASAARAPTPSGGVAQTSVDPAQPSPCTGAGKTAGCTPTLETAILAGGCFWGMEEILRKIPGVVSTEVGYAGGTPGVTYEDVHQGTTGNAESVRIVFDPGKLSYEDLLENWFFRMHDPTTRNRQGNDVGTQYRSAIFVTSPAQRDVAERVKRRVDASGHWPAPVVTEIVQAGTFTRAEDYHQHYLEKNPGGYTCHYLRDFPRTQL